jgi:AraC-like DNA-binding protein/quercetin dioxygenase-like cupin family protein
MDDIQKVDGFQNEYLFTLPADTLERLSKNDLFKSLLVTDIGYFPRARHHFRQRPEGCPASILLYCSAGSGFYSINGADRQKLSAGHIIIIPPGIPHVYGASEEDPWSVYWVHSNGLFFEQYYKMLLPRLPVEASDIMGENIKELFRQCFTLLKNPWQYEEYFYVCQLGGTIMAMLACIGKESDPQIALRGNRSIGKVITFIKEHLHDKLSLEDLTRVSGLGRSQLHNIFHKATGYPPIEYFLRAKIQAASRDLYFSQLPIKDIAFSYGIDDPYYFSRMFKKIMGVSPQRYRDQVKG